MNGDDFQDLYNQLRGSRSAMAVLDAKAFFMDKDYARAQAKLTEAYETYQESRTRLLRQDPEKQFAGQKDADRQTRRLIRKQEKAKDVLNTFAEMLQQLDRQSRRAQERAKAMASAAGPPQRTPAAPSGASSEGTNTNPADVKTEPLRPADPVASVPRPAEPVESAAGHESESDSAAEPQSLDIEFNYARPSSVSEKFLDEFQENWGDDQLDVINRAYGFLPIESEDDIYGDALYFIRKGDESYLVFTSPGEPKGDITLTNVVSRKPMSPISAHTFVQLGQQRRMVLLLDKENPLIRPSQEEPESESESEPTADPAPASESSDAEDDSGQSVAEFERDKQILDVGAFSQLMDAAQRSGLVPGADQIGFVRDREFKKGRYDLALQAIEGLNSKFTANAAARSQRLRQEEADISSGRIKISPKDLQAKRARDRAQDQAVERARSRFNRVLDGLRILMKTA